MKLSELTDELKPLAYIGAGDQDPTPIWVKATYSKTCDYGTLHRRRPPKSRFVVVKDAHGDFLVIDMFEVQLNDDYTTFTFPAGSVLCFPELDTAIMTAQLKL